MQVRKGLGGSHILSRAWLFVPSSSWQDCQRAEVRSRGCRTIPRHQARHRADARRPRTVRAHLRRPTRVPSHVTGAEQASEIRICSRRALAYDSASRLKLPFCLSLVLNPLST